MKRLCNIVCILTALVLLLVVSGYSAFGQGDLTATWSLNTDNTVTITGAGASLVTATPMAPGPGIGPVTYTTNGASSTGWTSGGSRDMNDYYEFTITAPANVYLTLTVAEFDVLKPTGNLAYMVVWQSTNGFANSSQLGDYNSVLWEQRHRLYQPLITLPPNTTYALRIYAYGSNFGSSDAFLVENFTFTGTSCQVHGDPAVFGNNSWNVYAYTGFNIDLTGLTYRGYYNESGLNFNTSNKWASNTSPSNAPDYLGCPIPFLNSFTYVYKRQGFPSGYYQIDVGYFDDHVRLYVNGTMVWQELTNCCQSAGNVLQVYLDETSTVEFRSFNESGSATSSLNFSLVTQPACVSTLFSQNFNGSTNVSDYYNANPNTGQFNTLGGSSTSVVHITSNALQFTMTGGEWCMFVRSANFNSSPVAAIIYKFSIQITTINSIGEDNACWQVGYNFPSGYYNTKETSPKLYAQFSTGWSYQTNKWHIYGTPNTFNILTTYNITWVLNNSGSLLTYTNPNNVIETVGNDQQDLWIGTTEVKNDVAVDNPGGLISDIKFVWLINSANMLLDNFEITYLPAALPVVDAPSNITVTGGDPVSVSFTGNGDAYTWTNDNTNTGLAAGGAGDISFTSADVISLQLSTVTVTPTGGFCAGTPQIFTITVNPACTNPDVPSATASPSTICSGESTTLSVASGELHDATAWYWYSSSCGVTPENTGSSISVSPTVTTTYYVRGEGGCVTTGACGDVTVNVNQSPAIQITDYTPPSCYGADNGSVQVRIAGTTSPYTFSNDDGAHWDYPVTGSYPDYTLAGLSAGTEYIFRVKDNNGCRSLGCTP